jgi:hypothetical protein
MTTSPNVMKSSKFVKIFMLRSFMTMMLYSHDDMRELAHGFLLRC